MRTIRPTQPSRRRPLLVLAGLLGALVLLSTLAKYQSDAERRTEKRIAAAKAHRADSLRLIAQAAERTRLEALVNEATPRSVRDYAETDLQDALRIASEETSHVRKASILKTEVARRAAVREAEEKQAAAALVCEQPQPPGRFPDPASVNLPVASHVTSTRTSNDICG